MIGLIYILFIVYLMAEKRPNIHPFFTVKKKKPTKSTEDAESSPDLSTSINDANVVNTEEIPDTLAKYGIEFFITRIDTFISRLK